MKTGEKPGALHPDIQGVRRREPEPGREALTQAGVVFGTPEYLSPEQALGDKIDARADLYATGVILFGALAGDDR